MLFKIIGEIYNIETITTGRGIRELRRLNRIYGKLTWRKRKGFAKIRLSDGTIKLAELHWYEGHMKNTNLVCVCSEGYKASLELRKLYEKIHGKEAKMHSQVRIIDESGEDYFYPAKYFAPVRLPAETRNRISIEQTA